MEDPKPLTEELILEAAQAVFLEIGLVGARMQEIADRAGINKALLNHYFRSKEKLSELIITRAVGATATPGADGAGNRPGFVC